MGTYKTDMPLLKVSAFFWVDYFLFLSEKDNRPRTTILAVVPHAHAHTHTQAAPPGSRGLLSFTVVGLVVFVLFRFVLALNSDAKGPAVLLQFD